MDIKNKLYLIAGGTASGKSAIADGIVRNVINNCEVNCEDKIVLVRMDNYYKTLKQLGASSVDDVNWDEPSAYNWDQIISDLKNLINGNEVNGHVYDYNIGGYEESKNFIIKPAKIIVFEGIYALYNEEIRNISYHKMFIHADADVRMLRRIKRDSSSRYVDTFNSEEFFKKWELVIKPMHKKYIAPTEEYADVIIKNNNDVNPSEKTQAITLIQSLMVK